ncbi:hypothetical protein [Sphingobacterium sp. BIGb0116]|uniref:hypothetical protein n=1 Tax=Sphingobacterium sp. BIGb0116 TaxID=2940619 RepID=UPI0021673BBC|nr:hypothetical protein [Sphingobacterium sp. BIGb0116]MCS4165168.1 hypothetical protein [Sphingobacterium sp. BIGb0116]
MQYFNWPGLGTIQVAMLHPYKEYLLAEMHLIQMPQGSCILYSLPDDKRSIESLLESKEHLIFLNELIEDGWQNKLARLYYPKIKRSIIDRQLFPMLNNIEDIEVSFQLELGQLSIVLNDEHTIHKEPFYDFVAGKLKK